MAAALCLASAGAGARDQEDGKSACRHDVFRLCRDAIPSQERIVACLNKKKRQLSPACRRIMSR